MGITQISPYSERDDVSLLNTINSIKTKLKITKSIKKPVSPFEDLWEDLTDTEKEKRIQIYEDLYTDIYNAIYSLSKNRGSIILREVFGDRFSYIEEEKDSTVRIVSISGAKPWGK